MKGFVDFIREQGVVGFAIGFILGGSVSKVVSSLVADIVNPVISIMLGSTEGLKDAKIALGGSEILWGHFLATTIDFIVVALVVYLGVKFIGVKNLDKKKE